MSADIPPRVRQEAQLADPDTTFEPGQRKAIRAAVRYCQAVGVSLADYDLLLEKIENGQVLTKRDRRRLQAILNKHNKQRLSPDERRLNAWARSVLWDAHRP